MPHQISSSVQDYLKALYLEQEGASGALVTTTALADRLGVSAASATNMLKRLEVLGFAAHVPYKGAELTADGRKTALEIIRHHRLLETYLAEALGVPWDEVHDEAERLEHALSEELEERISAHLGHPTADPHGHPIPDRDLSMPEPSGMRLWEVPVGSRVGVERVSDGHAETLRYLAGIGITPGAAVEVVARGPVGGPLFVKVVGGDDEGDVAALSRELAEAVWAD
jgi:DtxR family Mn-dependent transcriptional regulator